MKIPRAQVTFVGHINVHIVTSKAYGEMAFFVSILRNGDQYHVLKYILA